MYALLLQEQKTLTKPNIYAWHINISTWILKELLNLRPVHRLWVTNTMTQNIVPTTKQPHLTQELDEYGFVPKDKGIPKRKIPHAGRGTYTCKNRCKHIPKSDSRKVSYAKTKQYYCVTCSIAMKCVRCKCCSRLGRREPRSRCRITRQKENGGKYIE